MRATGSQNTAVHDLPKRYYAAAIAAIPGGKDCYGLQRSVERVHDRGRGSGPKAGLRSEDRPDSSGSKPSAAIEAERVLRY